MGPICSTSLLLQISALVPLEDRIFTVTLNIVRFVFYLQILAVGSRVEENLVVLGKSLR